MQAKQAYIIARFILFVMFFSLILSGCSMNEFSNQMMVDQGTLSEMSDPNGNVDLRGELEREGDVYKSYYDEKTGMAVSKTKYYANHFTDAFKLYGIYIAIPSFAVGFLIRRFVKSSAAVRKFGLVLEVWVPIIYIILAYVLSAIADRLR